MMMRNRKLLPWMIVGLLIFGFGCAQRMSYKDFKPLEVEKDEGVAIGKIKVVYNGKINPERCIVTIGSNITLLAKEGLIFVALDKGKAEITEVNCRGENDEISQNNNFKGAEFTVGKGVNYFGDVTIIWSNPEPQPKASASKGLMLFGAIGGAIGGGIAGAIQAKKDGTISMTVEDNMEEVLNAYKKHVNDETIGAEKNIIAIGTQVE